MISIYSVAVELDNNESVILKEIGKYYVDL